MNAPTPEEIAEFLAAHSRGLKDSPLNKLVPFVRWYWHDRRCAVLREHGEIVSVAMARCMTTPEQSADPYFHDENGPLIWVEDIVSKHPDGIGLLVSFAKERFGPREAFAGTVFVRAGELRMLPWKTVERLTTGALANVHNSARSTSGT